MGRFRFGDTQFRAPFSGEFFLSPPRPPQIFLVVPGSMCSRCPIVFFSDQRSPCERCAHMLFWPLQPTSSKGLSLHGAPLQEFESNLSAGRMEVCQNVLLAGFFSLLSCSPSTCFQRLTNCGFLIPLFSRSLGAFLLQEFSATFLLNPC